MTHDHPGEEDLGGRMLEWILPTTMIGLALIIANHPNVGVLTLVLGMLVATKIALFGS